MSVDAAFPWRPGDSHLESRLPGRAGPPRHRCRAHLSPGRSFSRRGAASRAALENPVLSPELTPASPCRVAHAARPQTPVPRARPLPPRSRGVAGSGTRRRAPRAAATLPRQEPPLDSAPSRAAGCVRASPRPPRDLRCATEYPPTFERRHRQNPPELCAVVAASSSSFRAQWSERRGPISRPSAVRRTRLPASPRC